MIIYNIYMYHVYLMHQGQNQGVTIIICIRYSILFFTLIIYQYISGAPFVEPKNTLILKINGGWLYCEVQF